MGTADLSPKVSTPTPRSTRNTVITPPTDARPHTPTTTVNNVRAARTSDYSALKGARPLAEANCPQGPTVSIPVDRSNNPVLGGPAARNHWQQPTDLGQLVNPTDYARTISAVWPSPTAEAYAVAPFHMRLYADVARSGVPNYMNVRRDVPSQLNCNAWDTALADYHDKELCQFMRYGWPVSFTASDPLLSTPKNYASALRHPAVISKFINKELEMEAMLGPFERDPFIPWTKVSPLMTRDKPSGTGKRVIIDLSFPPGRSVNDGVQKHAFQGRPFTYTLPSPLDLAEAILRAGPGASLWKADLERAYRQMRIDPLDYPLLAVRHQGRTYLDVCPSFGCRCSGGAQQRVSNSVVHLMTMAGYKTTAYVDDFCGVASDALTASRSLAEFKTITSRLGLSLAPDKTMTPTTQLEFLGLLFDTVTLTITIPRARLQEILDEAGRWTQKTTAQRHEVQSLAGELNFVSTCVLPARKFMGRILAALRAADERGVVEITPQFKKDLNWFLEYAKHCNRRVLIKPKLDQMIIECDACLRGGGGFSSTHYFDVVFT